METKRRFIPFVIVLIAGLLVPLIIPNQFYMQSIIYIVLYMYWASAWNILGGFAGLFSLGNGLYIGIGAYTSAVLFIYCGITPWIGMIISGLLAGALSIIIGYPVFRLKGMYYALATIALMCVFQIVFNNEPTILGIHTGGPDGLRIPMTGRASDMQFPGKTGYYYLTFGLLFVLLLVSDRIVHTKMGFYFRSIQANQEAAASLGVGVLRYKLTAHFISAFFTAIGGAVYTTTFLFVSSNIVFGMDLSFAMMLFCIVGGANTIWGPIIGALILVPVQQALRIAAGVKLAPLSAMIYGLALCLVILFMPDGILGWIKKFIEKRKSNHAGRLQAVAEETGKGGGLDD